MVLGKNISRSIPFVDADQGYPPSVEMVDVDEPPLAPKKEEKSRDHAKNGGKTNTSEISPKKPSNQSKLKWK